MEKILKKKTVFQGKIVSIEEVDIDFDNGKTATFELINFNVETGISILPIDSNNDVILIKQFRLGVKERIVSIPSGGLEIGEDPIEVANKELQEEIGYKSNDLSLMFRAHSSPGYVGSKAAYFFLAKDLTPSKLKGDEVGEIQIIKLPFDQVLKMVKSGEIIDMKTISAILYYKQYILNK